MSNVSFYAIYKLARKYVMDRHWTVCWTTIVWSC